jgi:YidC/Oxa1 family membrane protein insertase
MQREIMGLYQKYGVNPVGGCIPILIQIPIFFGLFGMLQSASELRFAEWLWVPDLSMPDTVARIAGMPINVLPLIMTVTVIFQMKLTPTPPTADAFQAKLFKVLPIVFCVFSYFFAAGLVLYWTVNNLFTIGQQYYINRQPEPELVEVKPGKAGGFAA